MRENCIAITIDTGRTYQAFHEAAAGAEAWIGAISYRITMIQSKNASNKQPLRSTSINSSSREYLAAPRKSNEENSDESPRPPRDPSPTLLGTNTPRRKPLPRPPNEITVKLGRSATVSNPYPTEPKRVEVNKVALPRLTQLTSREQTEAIIVPVLPPIQGLHSENTPPKDQSFTNRERKSEFQIESEDRYRNFQNHGTWHSARIRSASVHPPITAKTPPKNTPIVSFTPPPTNNTTSVNFSTPQPKSKSTWTNIVPSSTTNQGSRQRVKRSNNGNTNLDEISEEEH